MRKIILIVTLLFLVTELQAQNNPTALVSDYRIKEVIYRENDVIPIHGAAFTTTQIKFSDKEEILDIEGGDTSAWMVTYHSELPNMVFVKPALLHSNTNMTVITNKHAYYFQLISDRKLEGAKEKNTYALQFKYPEVLVNRAPLNSAASKIKEPKVLNTAYRFSGSTQLVPRHVFDDGKFTYFELSTNGAVPAIFAVDDGSGKESTVNTRREGKYIVVQRIAPQFTLRQGSLSTSVFNTQEINRIATNRRPK